MSPPATNGENCPGCGNGGGRVLWWGVAGSRGIDEAKGASGGCTRRPPSTSSGRWYLNGADSIRRFPRIWLRFKTVQSATNPRETVHTVTFHDSYLNAIMTGTTGRCVLECRKWSDSILPDVRRERCSRDEVARIVTQFRPIV